jgi:DNA-binding CsgD family transcriptional regulator
MSALSSQAAASTKPKSPVHQELTSKLDAFLSEASIDQQAVVRQLALALKEVISSLPCEKLEALRDRVCGALNAARDAQQSNAALIEGLFDAPGLAQHSQKPVDVGTTPHPATIGGHNESHVIDVRDADGMKLLSDGTALAAWELLRRNGDRLNAGEVSGSIYGEVNDVKRALGYLVDREILQCHPIRGRRRFPEYSCQKAGLVVEYRPNDLDDKGLMLEALSRIGTVGQDVALRAQSIANEATPPEAVRRNLVFSTHLDPSDAAELASRVDDLHAFMLLVESRNSGDYALDTAICNYRLDLRVSPIDGRRAASPVMVIRPEGAGRYGELPRISEEVASLSDREHQVAIGIVGCRSRREIAEKLGITDSTVATLTKRLYRKLGVHSRAELTRRIIGQR